ncbi:hypothetical protein U8335_03920 [Roseiconus lacunae]|uniref:Abi-alpha family protein n=1 Tax=Roseiconus lacunae TaxID=2605694 RepID=UPI0030894659|nr:hypothetical protein U8335_03920 [Stieleria sp. HD01]
MVDTPETADGMTSTDGADLTGIGKAMSAVPPEAWNQMVHTACAIVSKVLAPISETANGIGRLINAKFDRMIDVEQVMAAESIAAAKRKAEQTRRTVNIPRPQILLQVIENASSEVDGGIRELWSNLLAQELLTHAIHPEVGRVLSRLSFQDAQLLVEIAEEKPTGASALFAEAISLALRASPFMIPVSLKSAPKTFNHAHLQNLGLIQWHEGRWELTVFGEGFIASVTDPSLGEKGEC